MLVGDMADVLRLSPQTTVSILSRMLSRRRLPHFLIHISKIYRHSRRCLHNNLFVVEHISHAGLIQYQLKIFKYQIVQPATVAE